MPQPQRKFNYPEPFTYRPTIDEFLARFQEDLRSPLVRTEERLADGGIAVVLIDPEMPGFQYDFYVHSHRDALDWVKHLAEKTWVTKRHLLQFSALMLAAFKEGSNRA